MATDVDAPRTPRTILDMLQWRAVHGPDQPAIAALGEEFLTYDTIRRSASAVRSMVDLVAAAGEKRIGVYGHNVPAWVVASCGIWATGRSVAAVGGVLAPAEAIALLRLAGVTTVFTTLPAPELVAAGLRCVWLTSEGNLDPTMPMPVEPDSIGAGMDGPMAVDPDLEACVFFTSGTTGEPKGITHSHSDIMASCRQTVDAFGSHAAFRPKAYPAKAPAVQFNPYGHHGGYAALAVRFWVGRRLVLVPKFSVEAVCQAQQLFELETLQLTPAAIYMLATAPADLRLAGLRYVTSGTAPLSLEVRRMFEERFGVPVLSTYGMSETGAICQLRPSDVGSAAIRSGSVGRASAGVTIRILDDDGGDVAEGETGEIVVMTPLSPRTYIGSATARVKDGWFYTGDLGWRDSDGYIYVTGRRDDKLIVGGFNVYPGEVENAMLETGLVAQAVLVGVPDARLGERPVAGVVWRNGDETERLMELVRQRLAHYKVPRHVVGLRELPLTSRGKLDRPAALAAVREQLAGRAVR